MPYFKKDRSKFTMSGFKAYGKSSHMYKGGKWSHMKQEDEKYVAMDANRTTNYDKLRETPRYSGLSDKRIQDILNKDAERRGVEQQSETDAKNQSPKQESEGQIDTKAVPKNPPPPRQNPPPRKDGDEVGEVENKGKSKKLSKLVKKHGGDVVTGLLAGPAGLAI